MDFEKRLATRGAEEYAAFFVPSLRGDMRLLDCGCGEGAITYGLARLVREIVGVDFGADFAPALDYMQAHPRPNLSFAHADANALPFPDGTFDAVFAHSMLETLATPVDALTEMRRVLKDGGPIGAASVEYAGVLLAGPHEELLRRFYALREEQWTRAGHADPRRGARLRALLTEAGFRDIVASARYISYGTPEAVRAFAEDRAAQCKSGDYVDELLAFGLSTEAELREMATAWREWGASPAAFFAFPWCVAIGRK